MDSKVQMAIVTTVGGITSLLVKKLYDYAIAKHKSKTVASTPKVLTAEESDVFSFLDKIELDIIMDFTVDESVSDHMVKQEAFKDIMVNKIRIWRKILIELVQSVKCSGDCAKCGMTLVESRKIHMDALAKGILRYNDYYRNSGIHTEEQIKTLDICMPKFNKLHMKNADVVTNMISVTHKHPKYFKRFCPIMAMGLILDAYKQAFYYMFEDVTSTIDKMNGDLAGLTFKRMKYKPSGNFTESFGV